MSTPTPCPDQRQLHRLLTGLIAGEDAPALESHLAECALCLRVARGLRAGDPLATALFGCASADFSVEVYRAAEGLARRFGGTSPTRASGDAGNPTPVRDPSDPGRGPFDYLAPPQASDEMGRLGGFRVLGVLGEGGMGVVFRAHDPMAERPVALKVMQPRLAGGGEHRLRFMREARAVAGLRHDHVVTVYQVNEDGGVPFFAMELLEGETLAQRLRRDRRLDPDEAVRVAREAALGLAAAHERGVVHRDVKPANIWLESRKDGTGYRAQVAAEGGSPPSPVACNPCPPARVKVLDFGLALPGGGAERLTGSGAPPGTAPYMAPEQAAGRPEETGPWTDVYGLGVVLYRMLSGRLPFEGTPLDVVRRIREETPPPPSHFRPDLDPALEAVVLRAMAPRPADRYAGAGELAAALRAWSEGQDSRPADIAPHESAPPAPQRRRRGVLLPAAVLLLSAGVIFAGVYFAPAVVRIFDRHGNVVATYQVPDGGKVVIADEDAPAKPPADVTQEKEAPKPPAKGAPSPAAEANRATEVRPPARVPGVPGLISVLGTPAWRHWLAGSGRGVEFVFGPDGTKPLVWSYGGSGDDHAVHLWDAATGQLLTQFPRPMHKSGRWVPAYCDGRVVGLLSGDNDNWSWKLWDITGQREPVTLLARGSVLTCLALSRDGRLAASGTADGNVLLWDTVTGQLQGPPAPVCPGSAVQRLAFSPTEDILAVAFARADVGQELGRLEFWAPKARQAKGALEVPDMARCGGLAFSHDGVSLVAQINQPRACVKTFYVTAGRLRRSMEDLTYLAMAPDRMACAGADGVLRLCNLDGAAAGEFRGHPRRVTAAAFSTDGQTLASLRADGGGVQLWDLKAGKQIAGPDAAAGPARFVAASPGARRVAVGRADGLLQIWDGVTGKLRGSFQTPAGQDFLSAAFSPSGKLLAASTSRGEVWVWDADAQERLVVLSAWDRPEPVGPVVFSVNGKTLVCGLPDGVARFWEVAADREGWKPGPQRLDLQGRRLSGYRFVDLPSGMGVAAATVALGTDSKILATAGDGAVRLWDLGTGKELFVRESVAGAPRAVAFSGHGKRLAYGTDSGTLLVWELSDTGPPVEVMARGTVGPIDGVMFGPDCLTVYTASADGQVTRWCHVPAERVWQKQGHWQLPGPIHGLTPCDDCRRAIIACGNGTAWVLDLRELGS
jgi:serine/threonine protein kinase/WD40 repeat protein